MIEKPAEIITAYLTDSQNKEIVIDHEGMDYNSINHYTGDVTSALVSWHNIMAANSVDVILSATRTSYDENFLTYTHPAINDDWEYYTILVDFMLNQIPAGMEVTTGYITLGILFYYDESDPTKVLDYRAYYSASNYNLFERNTFRINITKNPMWIDKILSAWKIQWRIGCLNPATVQQGSEIIWSMGSPRVFFSDTLFFNTSWTPAPNFETLNRLDLAYTIGNEELLLQDFGLTESLCSQDNIKFGLCEAAHCEFSCVTTDNPKVGDKISLVSKLPGDSALTPDELIRINWSMHNPVNGIETVYNLYDPFFVLPICPDNIADWSHYIKTLKLSQYYLFTRFLLRFTFTNVSGTIPTYFKLIQTVSYNGSTSVFTPDDFELVSDCLLNYSLRGYKGAIYQTNKTLVAIKQLSIQFFDENKNPYVFGDTRCTYVVDVKEMRFCIGANNATVPEYDRANLMAANGTLDAYIYAHNNAIPLGIFYIDSVSKKYRHNLIEKKIEAYDNMVTLEQNAADWYTSYMFGLDTDDWTSNGFEFARQIFSSYFNYVISIGLETKDRYIESEIASYSYSNISSYLSNKYLSWLNPLGYIRLQYAKFTVSDPDPTKLYMVKCRNRDGKDDDYIIEHYAGGSPSYKEQIDPLSRGVCTNGGVLVWETRDNGTTAGFCVNRGDYFMISPNCTTFDVYIPVRTVDQNYGLLNQLVDTITIYEVESAPKLVNGYLRLCYYNYGTKEIFACNSSITGRDVVRSLLEVCGCFFRLSRFNGLPEFVYPTKGGLYPSHTLFPADDLYPRSGTDGVYPMGRYMSIIAENYQVQNYGRIQILKDSKTNDTVSVCEWQYEGDPNAENTYIIDDNIFYCADDMMYDYDNMPEVAQMLAGMWEVVSNLGYVPNITEAIGSPWIECGDRLGLLTYDGGIETFVFRRTLKGIQNLKDTYESVGDEYIEAIDTFAY